MGQKNERHLRGFPADTFPCQFKSKEMGVQASEGCVQGSTVQLMIPYTVIIHCIHCVNERLGVCHLVDLRIYCTIKAWDAQHDSLTVCDKKNIYIGHIGLHKHPHTGIMKV